MLEVASYLLELGLADKLSAEDYCDAEFNAGLREAVQRGLQPKLTGGEKTRETRALAREVIENAIE